MRKKRRKYCIKFYTKSSIVCSSIAEVAEKLGYTWTWIYVILKRGKLNFKGDAENVRSIHIFENDRIIKKVSRAGEVEC